MTAALKILFVDDDEPDVILARRHLERDGLEFEWRRVTSETELRCELASFKPDVVLCDYSLPGYSGLAALELVRNLQPSTPTLFVSGTISEDLAIACLERGAADYLLKSNLRRLAPAVRRAVADARERAHARAVEERTARLTVMLEATADMIVMCDADGRINFVNDAGCRLLAAPRESIVGRDFQSTCWPQATKRARHQILAAAIESGSWQGEVAIEVPDGTTIATSQIVTAHRAADGRILSFSVVAHDLRARNAYEARIHQLAHYDALTGLPNLAHIKELLSRSTAAARRKSCLVALVSVNLNRFRLVDAGLGRGASNAMLKTIGAALAGAVRERDAVARVGPDEFLIVLSGLADPMEATVLVQRILDCVSAPRQIGSQELQITATAGLAFFPHDGSDFETLARKAGAAMHAAKSDCGGGFRFHSGDVERHAKQRLRLESSLRKAILRQQLAVHYQPQFEVRTGRACGVEALVRWFPQKGASISPAVFVPLAEQSGLISALGSWVLHDACATVAAWRDRDDGPPTLGINVSPHQLRGEFNEVLAHALEVSGFPPDRLELEITEGVLIDDSDFALDCMARWKQLGVRIAVDDFGTGYSGLSYLSRLPVDRLKMDKSLVHGMTRSSRDAAIVRSMVALGRDLGIAVLAEGVETSEQLEMLKEFGCTHAQGFLLSTPKSAAQAREVVNSGWGARSAQRCRSAGPDGRTERMSAR